MTWKLVQELLINRFFNHFKFFRPFKSVFFFPREPSKYAREHFEKNAREYFFLPVNKWQKCGREQWKSTREQEKRCPWTSEVAVNHKKVPVNHINVPVKKSKKMPVNASSCPWILSKMCPWTQKCAREKFWKSGVHGHFQGSREKKTLKQTPREPMVVRKVFFWSFFCTFTNLAFLR